MKISIKVLACVCAAAMFLAILPGVCAVCVRAENSSAAAAETLDAPGTSGASADAGTGTAEGTGSQGEETNTRRFPSAPAIAGIIAAALLGIFVMIRAEQKKR